MESVSKQEYMRVLSELDMLTTKFVALEQENQKLLVDLQHVSTEKAQQHEELSHRVQQLEEQSQRVKDLEAALLTMRQQASGLQIQPREPKISLPAKFDGTRSQFRGFLNQVRLVIQMHPNRYPTDISQVGLVGTLLTGTALAWFAPLLEKNSPLLHKFDEFIKEFQASFGDTDSVRTAINKLRRLRQGDRPASAYASDFRLLASDIPWDEEALMDQFRYGLRNDVKDLLLTFHEDPKSLTEAISRAVRCDNRLFERRSEQQMTRFRSEPTYASVVANPSQSSIQPLNSFQENGPTPMEIDAARRRGPLTEAEKQRRRANRLCLYCGGPGHIAIHCPHRPRTRRINQVSIIDNFESSSPVKVNRPCTSPCIPQSNNFEVLSQLDDLLNE
jgi:hypothetical protein